MVRVESSQIRRNDLCKGRVVRPDDSVTKNNVQGRGYEAPIRDAYVVGVGTTTSGPASGGRCGRWHRSPDYLNRAGDRDRSGQRPVGHGSLLRKDMAESLSGVEEERVEMVRVKSAQIRRDNLRDRRVVRPLHCVAQRDRQQRRNEPCVSDADLMRRRPSRWRSRAEPLRSDNYCEQEDKC